MNPQQILFPGWGIPPDKYQASIDSKIIDYHFFTEDDSKFQHPSLTLNVPSKLIGHSLGTVFAIQTALRNPEQTTTLILYAPFTRLIQSISIPGHPASAATAMIRQCSDAPTLMLRAFWRNLFYPQKTPLSWQVPEFINTPRLADGLKILLETNLSPLITKLAKAQFPIQIHCAQHDKIVMPEMTRYFSNTLPNAKLILHPECGHHFLLI